jgi:hypothetical protein
VLFVVLETAFNIHKSGVKRLTSASVTAQMGAPVAVQLTMLTT